METNHKKDASQKVIITRLGRWGIGRNTISTSLATLKSWEILGLLNDFSPTSNYDVYLMEVRALDRLGSALFNADEISKIRGCGSFKIEVWNDKDTAPTIEKVENDVSDYFLASRFAFFATVVQQLMRPSWTGEVYFTAEFRDFQITAARAKIENGRLTYFMALNPYFGS